MAPAAALLLVALLAGPRRPGALAAPGEARPREAPCPGPAGAPGAARPARRLEGAPPGGAGAEDAEGAAAHGPGHGHGAAEHGEAVSEVDFVVMCMFFGTIVGSACMIAFLNFPDADVRVAAHYMLCVAVSVFCAMTLWDLFQDFLFGQVISGDFPRGFGIKHLEEGAKVVILFLIFLCIVAATNWACHITCHSRLKTWFGVSKILIPHLAGFAGFAVCESLLEVALKFVEAHELPVYSVVLVPMTVYIVLNLIRILTYTIRGMACYTNGLTGEQRHKCQEAIQEGEDEAVAFIMSGLLYGFAQYLILNLIGCTAEHMLTMVPTKMPKECSHSAYVAWWSAIFLPTALLLTAVASGKVFKQNVGGPLRNRIVPNLTATLGMLICRLVMGVCVHWMYWHFRQPALVYMCAALIATVISIVFTIVFDFVADKLEKQNADQHGYQNVSIPHLPSDENLETRHDIGSIAAGSARAFIGVFGLLVGLSWEAVFEHGEKGLVAWANNVLMERGVIKSQHHVILQSLLSIMVLFAMLPPWAKFLIPRSADGKEFHQKRIDHEKDNDPEMFHSDKMSMLYQRCCHCCKRRKRHGVADREDERSDTAAESEGDVAEVGWDRPASHRAALSPVDRSPTTISRGSAVSVGQPSATQVPAGLAGLPGPGTSTRMAYAGSPGWPGPALPMSHPVGVGSHSLPGAQRQQVVVVPPGPSSFRPPAARHPAAMPPRPPG